jgi:DnaJ family protein C protein 2
VRITSQLFSSPAEIDGQPFSRDDKRYTEKKNKSERARRKKEDTARLRNIVDVCLSVDPRIKRIKQEEKEAREAKKRGRSGTPQTQKEKEEEKKKAEEEAKRKEEEEKVRVDRTVSSVSTNVTTTA